MRTTVNIDDDLLRAARSMANARSLSIGRILSDLIRAGLSHTESQHSSRNGFPVFDVPADAPIVSLTDVANALDDDA